MPAKKTAKPAARTAPKSIAIIYHYQKSDPDCGGDYEDVEVLVDGQLAASYGDHYHEKGADKADGFVEGLNYAFDTKLVPVLDNVADRGDDPEDEEDSD